jgi:hypothetical protein
MYKIPVAEFEGLRLKVGTVCQVNSGQPCEELHGILMTLKDETNVMVVHAVDKDKKNIIDDSEITKVDGEAIADYEQWKSDNIKPSEEL